MVLQSGMLLQDKIGIPVEQLGGELFCFFQQSPVEKDIGQPDIMYPE